ncbi:MAG TPA: PKD domain-containing protein, partial [Ktedonobacteraceae bacterium]|nr:PKD domain-containing protein [Ktedonobacteraceae bacterium]
FTREAIANAVSYKWDFGDGTTATVQNPSHTYANPGAYTIKLSATGNCGSTYEFSAQINAPYYNTLKNLPEAGFQQVVAFSPSLIYYLGTSGKFYRTDTSGNWTTISLPTGLAFNSDTRLYTDQSNTLWIYGRKEVAKLNTNGTSWTSYFSTTGLANNTTIEGIAVDNNNEIWTLSGGVLRKGNTVIHSSVSFSSLAYAPGTNRIWLTSQSSAGLYYINTNSTQLNPVSNTSITGGGDEIQIVSNGDIYVTTSTGIVRMNSTGSTTATYNSSTTNGLISTRPSAYDFDAQGNMWVLLSGQLYKVPLANPTNTKKYSFNAELSNISSISVLDLSSTDSDILLAKTSGNAAIKIR